MTSSSPEPTSLPGERAARHRAEVLDAALDGEPAGPLEVDVREATGAWPADGEATVGLHRLLVAAGAARTAHRPPAPPAEGLAELRAAARRRQQPIARRHRSIVRLAGVGTAAAAMLVIGLVAGSSLGGNHGAAPPARRAQVELETVAHLIDGARKALASSHPTTADSLLHEAQQLATAAPSASGPSRPDVMATQLAHDQAEISTLQQQLSAVEATAPTVPPPPTPTTAVPVTESQSPIVAEQPAAPIAPDTVGPTTPSRTVPVASTTSAPTTVTSTHTTIVTGTTSPSSTTSTTTAHAPTTTTTTAPATTTTTTVISSTTSPTSTP